MIKLNHIGVAVRKIENTLPFYQNGLGLSPHFEEVLSMKVKTAKLTLDNTVIELIEPMEGNENVAKFIQNKGEGIHHICFEVADIKSAMADMVSKGYKLVYPEPKTGAGGYLVNFFSPKDSSRVLIEICQFANKH
ncbi:MAG: methylmalonyl-CoA epimerase [Planctomycetes bacterium]|nr:methylmalonyl-CoA epimerase [Planctomycetota bacterium]